MLNPQGESNLESITLAATPAPEGVEGLLSLLLEQWDEQAIDSSIEPEPPATTTPLLVDSAGLSIASIDASAENPAQGDAPVAAELFGIEQFRHDLGQLIDSQETSLTIETSTDLEEQSSVADQPVVPSTENSQIDEQSLVMLFDSIPVIDDANSTHAESESVANVTWEIEEEISTGVSSDTHQRPIESSRIIPLEPSILFEESVEDSVAMLSSETAPRHGDVASDADLDNLFQFLLGSTEPVTEVTALEPTAAADLSLEAIPDEADLLGSLLAGMADKEVTPEQLAIRQKPSVKEIGPLAKFVIFRLAEQGYAIPMQRVLETDRMPRVTFVPGLPSSLRGITNLRGDILPIVDLRQLFGLGETELTAGHRLLVVKSNDDSQVGLIVDALGGLGTFGIDLSPDEQQIENEEIKQLLNGRGEHKGQTVNVLDLDKVFTITELQELAA